MYIFLYYDPAILRMLQNFSKILETIKINKKNKWLTYLYIHMYLCIFLFPKYLNIIFIVN